MLRFAGNGGRQWRRCACVAERTADLQAVNTELDDSRHAAINLMEDALDARRQTEDVATALRESEEQFRLLVEGVKDYAIFMLDAEGVVLSWNTGAERIKGYREEEIIGKSFSVFYSPEEIERRTPDAELKAAEAEGRIEVEGWRIRKDGTRFWANVVITALRNQDGKVVGFSKITRNITERKRAEKTLQESELKYSLLFDKLAVAASLTKLPETVFADVNKAFEKLFGYTREEVVGKTSLELGIARPEESNVTFDEVERAGQHVDAEKHVLTKSGEERIVLINVIALELNGQNYALTTMQDISDRKKAEERIKAALAEKEVMLREIHHRVKNNMQIISSLVSLQADTLADEGMREVFGDVRDRVRAMALVHEKLYQTGDLAHLNFADYASSLLQYLWRSHGALAEKVRLNLEVAPVTMPIEAAVPCGLILNELAGNALKHAFPGNSGGEVTVGLKLDPATETVCLRVSDNGDGLPAGFDWRQSRSLGLRLVQMLAGQLRGTVETGSGQGAEFRVTFPLKGFNS